MVTLLSGPFYPSLETALVETVQQEKTADLRAPLAIILPSDSLRRRVQWLLCVEHSCALFDLHFLTFHQFALHLHRERQALGPPEAQNGPFKVVGDFFYEYLLSVLLEQDRQFARPFASRESSSGLRQALWRSLRDLQEAQVDSDLALRAAEEGVFDAIATDRLRGLFNLQAALNSMSRQQQVGLPEDLAQSVISWVPHSPFIARLSTVIYYGFYDLTQVQLSLLEEVARANAVKLFFPLADQPAYRFAKQFLERHLLKAGVVHQVLPGVTTSGHRPHPAFPPPEVQVVNVIGEQGELSFTCKAILHAVEQRSNGFHEIGVVARNLEPYVPYLQRIFDDHRIPFSTTVTAPLLEEPLAKVWWQLAGLREEQYLWRSLLDVVTSPFYRDLANHVLWLGNQGHLWKQAVRHLRIVRGREDWERLKTATSSPGFIRDWQRMTGLSPEEASAALQTFAEVVDRLIKDCQALPESGSIGELTQAFETFVHAHLFLSDGLNASPRDGIEDARLMTLVQGLEQTINLIGQLDGVNARVTWRKWVEVFRKALETVQIPIPGQSPMGVRVMNAMAARGQTFRTLFLLGMNDKVFPRVVREDAFLRDRDRLILSETLGYKIDEKMKGFDEETLLFALLRHSVRDRVYCIYQRADDRGRPLLPSSLLTENRGNEQSVFLPEIGVPLRMTERVTVPFFSSGGETLQETRLRLLLLNRSIQPDSPESPVWWEIFQNGVNAVSSLEQTLTEAGRFDGIIAEEGAHWQDCESQGISPTALESYVQCPFRYWLEQILHARDHRESFSRDFPGRVWGELGHAILRRVYQHLVDQGWPVSLLERDQLSSLITSNIEQVSDSYAAQFGKGYLVLWEKMKRQFAPVVWAMIEHDQQEYAAQGIVPEAFEVEAEGEVPGGVPGFSSFRFRGRMDRVDRHPDDPGLRIVDYKFSSGLKTPAGESDLLSEALQGRRLQPPLYSFMSSLSLSGQNSKTDSEPELPLASIHSVEFRYVRPLNPEPLKFASFSTSTWETAAGRQLLRTIQRWISSMRAGRFFVLPGPYCRGCHGSAACRIQHHPSWARAYKLALAKEFRQLRKQRMTHE